MNLTPELKKRIATGAMGAAVLLGLIAYGKWIGIFIITLAISLGMVVEFANITFSMPDRLEKKYVLLSILWFVSLTNLLIPQNEFHLFVFSFLFLFSYFLFSARRHRETQFNAHFIELIFSVFALVYVIFVPLYFLRLYEAASGVAWVILFLLIVWAGDTVAYFVGKKFGRRKLYPEISPKKTFEGALGGLAAGVVVTFGYKLFYLQSLSWVGALLLPILVGAVAQVGDLCESFLKRSFDKKDSGTLLPGHGGFLDRFDGVVFSLPIMYICMRLFS